MQKILQMNTERKEVIVSKMFEWCNVNKNISYKEALFALYDDRMISGEELDELMSLSL